MLLISSNSKISWSKNGFIAYSDYSSSTNLSITKLESIKGSSWRLSPKKTYQIKTNPNSKLNEIKLVQWSTSGSDLAIIDDLGNLTVLGTGIVKTSPTTQQVSCFEDIEILYQDDVTLSSFTSPSLNSLKLNPTVDGFNSVIAFKWLNVDKPVISSSPAMRTDKGYNYSVHQYKSYGALHGIQGKSGFFALRRNGDLSFYYQTLSPSFEFRKIGLELESEGEKWLESASIGYNRDGTVIIATYSALYSSLKIYKVLINWGSDPQQNLQPVVQVEKLINDTVPKIGDNGLFLQLNNVEIISSNFSLDTELDILLTLTGPGVSNGKTLLQKYQISNEFKGLRFKNDTNTVDGYPNLVFCNEISIKDDIVSLNTKNFDFLIVLVLKNGDVQLRNRKTLGLQSASKSSISSLFEVGFKFQLPHENLLSVAISPCLCGLVSLQTNKLTFYSTEKTEKNWNDEEILTVSAAASYLFASACYTSTGADELIASLQREVSQIEDLEIRNRLMLKILEESHRALNFSLDFSKDQIDRLLVNPPIQKLLSLQYSLGKYAKSNQQSLMASSILNLRLVSFSIMLSLRTSYHQQQRIAKKGNVESVLDAIYRSENLLSTVGTINWFVEFLVFTIQELVKLITDPTHKSIVLALCLSKIPRSLMLYSIAGIKRIAEFFSKIEEGHKKYKQLPINMELFHKSVARFRTLLSIVDLGLFEKFFAFIEQTFQNNDSNSLSIEQELVFQNRIPVRYSSCISSLFNKFEELFQNTDLSRLFFHDTTWLNFSISNNTFPKETISSDAIYPVLNLSNDLIDHVTKMKITNKTKLKKCVRCECITSDPNSSDSLLLVGLGTNSNANHWPVAFHRTCICGSCWIYVNVSEVVQS